MFGNFWHPTLFGIYMGIAGQIVVTIQEGIQKPQCFHDVIVEMRFRQSPAESPWE